MDIEKSAQIWRGLPPQVQAELANASLDQIIEVTKRLGIDIDPFVLLKAREDALTSEEVQSVKPKEEKKETPKPKEGAHRRPRRIHHSYDSFSEQAKLDAQKKAKAWEKKPDLALGGSRDEVYQRSLRESYDDLVRLEPETAKLWLKENKEDEQIRSAQERAEAAKRPARSETVRTEAAVQELSRPRGRLEEIAPIAQVGEIQTTPVPQSLGQQEIITKETRTEVNPPRVQSAPSQTVITRSGPGVYPLTRAPRTHPRRLRPLVRRVGIARRFKRRAEKRFALFLATAGLGLPRIVIAMFVVVPFIVFLTILFAGCTLVNNPIGDLLGANYCKVTGTTDGGDTTPTPTPSPQPSQCQNNDFIKCLKDEFNFIIQYEPGRERVEDLYNILSELGVSARYRGLLRSSGPTYVYFVSGTDCAARVRNYTTFTNLILYDFGPGFCSRTERKDRITHETGHVIKGGHARLFQRYEDEAYYPRDSFCFYYQYDSSFDYPYWFIRTYDTDFAKDNNINISGSNESMADSMALYVRPESPLDFSPRNALWDIIG